MNIMLSILIFSVIFISYNSILIYFASYIFESKKMMPKIILSSTLINGVLYFCYIYFIDSLHFEAILILGYMISYALHFRFLYKQNFLSLLFGVSAFTLNFVSRRLLTLCILSLVYGVSMGEFYSDFTNRMVVNLLPMVISAPYILVTKKFTHKRNFDMIFMNRDNIKFAVSLMLSVCAYAFFTSIIIDPSNASSGYIGTYLIIAICCSVSYHITLIYSFTFTKLQLNAVKIGNMRNTIKEERDSISKLQTEYETDHFTGFKTRKYITELIDTYIKDEEDFYISFIDIDGLKKVNDEYGHVEGDFYIKNVSLIIEEIFNSDEISRYGGDEFLIVGKSKERYLPTKKALYCFENVAAISKNYQKDYNTSISYSILMVNSSNKLTSAELIKEADERMYEFKRSRKKERSVVKLPK